MVLDRPDHFFAQEWAQYFGCKPVMVLRCQSIADIVEKRSSGSSPTPSAGAGRVVWKGSA